MLLKVWLLFEGVVIIILLLLCTFKVRLLFEGSYYLGCGGVVIYMYSNKYGTCHVPSIYIVNLNKVTCTVHVPMTTTMNCRTVSYSFLSTNTLIIIILTNTVDEEWSWKLY